MIDIQTQTLLRNIMESKDRRDFFISNARGIYNNCLGTIDSPITILTKSLKLHFMSKIPENMDPLFYEMLQLELVKIDWRFIATTLIQEVVK